MLRLPALVLAALVAVALVGGGDALKLTKCPLVRVLKANGIPQGDLRNWVCMVQAESGGDTSVKGSRNKNGSYDYGLFQINDKYWCGTKSAGGDCNVKCSDLLDDDVTNDIACAKKIKARHGFKAWYGWRNKCDGKTLPDISSC